MSEGGRQEVSEREGERERVRERAHARARARESERERDFIRNDVPQRGLGFRI